MAADANPATAGRNKFFSALCAPLGDLCGENAVPEQRVALPVSRATSNAGGTAIAATHHRVRRAERRARRASRSNINGAAFRPMQSLVQSAWPRPGTLGPAAPASPAAGDYCMIHDNEGRIFNAEKME